MPRYLVSHRLAGKTTPDARIRSSDALRNVLSGPLAASADVLHHAAPHVEGGRRVATLEADEGDIQAMRDQSPDDVIVEKEIPHTKPKHHPLQFHAVSVLPTPKAPPSKAPPSQATLALSVSGDRGPLADADVKLMLRGGDGAQMELHTDGQGKADFEYAAELDPAALMVVPAAQYWSKMMMQPPIPTAIACESLPKAQARLGWWHEALGLDEVDPERGRGVRIGVLDSGLAPHPALGHVKSIGAFIGGKTDRAGGGDVSYHGTYTSGIIAAYSDDAAAFGGFAPGATSFSARIFDESMESSQADIANALDALVLEHRVDLVNMSLSSDERSLILHDAIIHAMERGTLCICAAGNARMVGGEPRYEVGFPAAFPETIAVSAVGRLGWGPPDSASAQRKPTPDQEDRFARDLYLANLSSYGDQVNCTAPGVGIVSTVPPQNDMPTPYLAMDGTSAASPAVCGALAGKLGEMDEWLAMPRDSRRAQKARQVLLDSCRSVGLDAKYEGAGLPQG